MPQLLNLPVEVRLRIYHFVVFEPWPVSIPQSSGIGITPRLRNTQSISQVDTRLSNDILSLYWSTNTFSLPINGAQYDKSADEDFLRWLWSKHADEYRAVRHLEFVIKMRCPHRGQKHVGTRIRAAPTCTTKVSVDLTVGVSSERAVEITDDEGCSHQEEIMPRFRAALEKVPRMKMAPQLDPGALFELKEAVYPAPRTYGEVMLPGRP